MSVEKISILVNGEARDVEGAVTIEELLRGRISFLIAHRLSTIRSADRILVIDRGKMIEHGTHRELLAARSAYYRLYTNQKVEEGARAVLTSV